MTNTFLIFIVFSKIPQEIAAVNKDPSPTAKICITEDVLKVDLMLFPVRWDLGGAKTWGNGA